MLNLGNSTILCC